MLVAQMICDQPWDVHEPGQGLHFHAQHQGWWHRTQAAKVCLGASSKAEPWGCRSKAPSPGLSAKLTPSPPGKSTAWLHHFGKHETELLRDAGLWSCWGNVSALRPISVLQGMP